MGTTIHNLYLYLIENIKITELLDQYYVLLEIEFETFRVKC